MPQTWTNADFDQLSWHDNYLYGLYLSVGDPDRQDWRSDLVLDIDHILEWVRGDDDSMKFLVAPATLTFHGVTDLKIDIDWGDSGGRTALHPMSIDRIARTPVKDQKVHLDRPYYRWRIIANWPKPGEIRFCAADFTQTPRAEPVLTGQQSLAPANRPTFEAR